LKIIPNEEKKAENKGYDVHAPNVARHIAKPLSIIKKLNREKNIKSAKNLFIEIMNENPTFNMEINDNQYMVDIGMDIKKQDKLIFDINLNLQNDDELHISTGQIWCSWFPLSDEIIKIFKEAVNGILLGNYRIREFKRFGETKKSYLEKLANGKWEIVYKYHHKITFPFLKYQEVITRNG